jgi:transcription antitermination protein NusB
MIPPVDIKRPSAAEPGRRRTAARLAAVQALYQIELTGASPANAVGEYLKHPLGTGEGEDFGAADENLFADLVEGTCARREELDRHIAAALTADWPLERLEIILRAILRAGAYELLARPEVPARVAISEYLDIAHAFFAGKEPGLVNGVLDRLARTLRPEGLRGEDGGSGAASR